MRGLDEARKFYNEVGADMLREQFPEYEARIAVGLVGRGSECYGFDDDVSRDHDYEVGFAMWLSDEDESKIGFRLTRAYDKLKAEWGGEHSKHRSVLGYASDGVMTVRSFYSRYLPGGDVPSDLKEWLYTESEFFREATNGEVFRDDLGEFSRIRRQVLCGMPEDVWTKKLAARCLRMAKSGQYNYARCISHGEEGAAMMALTDFVKNAAEAIYVLNRVHAPYFKWLFRGMRELSCLSELSEPLQFLLTADNDEEGRRVKRALIEDIAHSIVKKIEDSYNVKIEDDYLEPVAFKLNSLIKDSTLRDMHILLA